MSVFHYFIFSSHLVILILKETFVGTVEKNFNFSCKIEESVKPVQATRNYPHAKLGFHWERKKIEFPKFRIFLNVVQILQSYLVLKLSKLSKQTIENTREKPTVNKN